MLKKEFLNFGFTEEEYDIIINNYRFERFSDETFLFEVKSINNYLQM